MALVVLAAMLLVAMPTTTCRSRPATAATALAEHPVTVVMGGRRGRRAVQCGYRFVERGYHNLQ